MDAPCPGSQMQELSLSEQDWTGYVRRVCRAPGCPEVRAGGRRRKIIQCVLRAQSQGRWRTFVVHSRDIAAGGMSFLHHEPLADEAACSIVLETNSGQGHLLDGRVRWTRSVGGGLHAVGVAFSRAMDLRDFVDVADADLPATGADAA